MPQPTLKTIITTIILPSLTNEPDTRLKGTEKLKDHLEEELEEESLSQIKIQIKTQPDTPTPMQSGLDSLTFNSESNCELDSHADTCELGKHAHILMDHGKAVNIVRYDKSKGTLVNNIKTVSGALAYDNPTSGKTVIIVVHQAIHVPTMDCNLIGPITEVHPRYMYE